MASALLSGLLILALARCSSSSFFTADLAKSNQHSVQISKVPININQVEGQVDSFIIANRNGRKFSCSLPVEEDLPVEDDSETSSVETAQQDQAQTEADEIATETPTEPEEEPTKTEKLLTAIKRWDTVAAPLPDPIPRYKNTPDEVFAEESFPRTDCIYHSANGDWWAYEICLGQYIRQFHWGQDNIPKQITVIGLYESDFNWDVEIDSERNAREFDDFERYGEKSVHLQYYNSGDLCDVTKKPRNAKLIYKCVDQSWLTNKVHTLREPATCAYEIVIHSPAVCHALNNHAKEDEKVQVNQVVIQCSKVLSEEEYSLWSQIQEKNRLEQEAKSHDLLSDFFEQTKMMAEQRYGEKAVPKTAEPIREGTTSTQNNAQNQASISGLDALKSQITAKGLEAISNFVSKSFNHAVEEDVDDMQIIMDGSVDLTPEQIQALKDKIKATKKKQDPNFGSKMDKPAEGNNVKGGQQGKLNLDKEIKQVQQEKYNDDLASEDKIKSKEKSIQFVDGNNEDLGMTDGDGKINDQLKALQKAIETDLKENGDVEAENRLAGLTNIKIQIMDENGEVHSAQDLSQHVEKLPEGVLQQIKSALMMAISNEKPEKGRAAENDFSELSSSYNEEVDLFDGSGEDEVNLAHDEL